MDRNEEWLAISIEILEKICIRFKQRCCIFDLLLGTFAMEGFLKRPELQLIGLEKTDDLKTLVR